MLDELKKEFGDRLHFVKKPTLDQIKSADVVLCSVGTSDSEGWDRPFALPPDQENRVKECVTNNPRTVVIVTSGSGIRMTDWDRKAGAILYVWYGGQTGNKALAEIIAGTTTPSGKLPMTIEREFSDAPGHDYLPDGESLYTGWNGDGEKNHPVYNVRYNEGVFVGYRWYEKNKIEPLYHFGHGISYTSFEYSDLDVSKTKFHESDVITVSFKVKNTGKRQGLETAQLYIQDVESTVPRPLKELKGFLKVDVKPGQSKTVTMKLHKENFSFWNPATQGWFVEKGKFVIHVGTSSADIRLRKEIELQ
jgi:beta-glucosidase